MLSQMTAGLSTNTIFSNFSGASSQKLEIRPALLHGDMLPSYRPVTDCRTNDQEWQCTSCQNPFL